MLGQEDSEPLMHTKGHEVGTADVTLIFANSEGFGGELTNGDKKI